MQEILEAQRQLQAEADQVVTMLNLNELLREVGTPTRVGSSAMGLMVRRDIDITVACAKLDKGALAAFVAIGAKLAQRSDCVVATRFRNDSGKWNVESEKYPDGMYLWLSVAMPDGAKWTVDVWLVDEPERQPDLAHLRTLLPRLSDVDRSTILQIKQALIDSKISSALVYEAVMDHGVRNIAEFERWHHDRRS